MIGFIKILIKFEKVERFKVSFFSDTVYTTNTQKNFIINLNYKLYKSFVIF